ncbi:unnamed protein product (macronuclear) [Paramecium tetraurelia]|uniref:CCR4-NOT transcription complex subunit 11 n=1 Tax=Paramecium tetraurelia TaxID=5888 RepID=A0BSX1_PARTE|nr:uncharacterized protein GSPATT00031870001 [Paramecium tetraurelia]CAK61638.1 unnamed protein product [Paramecium tetraurelia]|eukprot:XP_001429036.1 hypothetical protein (macronuclear) [Paramecium tetraurelia strain d4-2]
MQVVAKIPVEINKTLDENYKVIKDQCKNEMLNQMINSLLDQKQAPHIRLQFLYNIRQQDQNIQLSDLCINQLELNIVNNIKYYGQSLEQILRYTDLLNQNKIEFSCEFMRPIPITFNSQSFDYIQLDLTHQTIWDYSITPLMRFRHILYQAQCTKLQQGDHQLILSLFKPEYKIDWNQFKLLVEYNPQLVSDLITKLYQLGVNANVYLDCLIQIKISIQTLELVNQLSKSISLPDQFFNMFIRKCIVNCEEYKIPQQLTRQVRLVSVFIRTLIKQKTFDPKKIYVELQGFCLEFSSILEATQLFKTIKNAVQEQ